MKTYIGTKVVQAEPVAEDEARGIGYRVIYPDGYESWSPKEEFERCYREISPEERDLVE